jgi:hypothetical protein
MIVLFSQRISGGKWQPRTFHVLSCIVCSGITFASDLQRPLKGNENEHEPKETLWPAPTGISTGNYPPKVGATLSDAIRCYQAKAFSACAVMCGKAIEIVCNELVGPVKNLEEGLRKLKDAGIIDELLFKWGNLLRKERNIGAHASSEPTSRSDASDALEFCQVMCEYIFVLSKKYQAYMERKGPASS